MTTPTEVRALADTLKERFGGTVPTSQAAAALRSLADQVEALEYAIQEALEHWEAGAHNQVKYTLDAAIDRAREAT